jgi:hypothetical protein
MRYIVHVDDGDVTVSYRTRSAVIGQYVCCVAAVLLIVVPALVDLLDARSDLSSATALFIALGLVIAVFAWRGGRSRVVASDAGVDIVNPWRRHVVAWSAIRTFRLGRWGLLPRQGIVELHDGSRIGMWAISARNPDTYASDPKAERIIEELSTRLRGYRDRGEGRSSP